MIPYLFSQKDCLPLTSAFDLGLAHSDLISEYVYLMTQQENSLQVLTRVEMEDQRYPRLAHHLICRLDGIRFEKAAN